VWQGRYSTANDSDNGVLTLDLTRTNDALKGKMIVRSRTNKTPYTYLYVKGSWVGDAVTLELDADEIPYSWQLAMTGTAMNRTLSGSFSAPPWNLVAEFVLADIEVKTLAVNYSVVEPNNPRGLTVHKDHLWVSKWSEGFEGFEKRDLSNAAISSVTVFLSPGLQWSSNAFTSDGTDLVGHVPVSVPGDPMSPEQSDIVRFTEAGDVVDRYRVNHRVSGMTHDGTDFWSVSIDSDSLYRFDDTGTVLETLPIELPDAIDIYFDGQAFWAASWFFGFLYKLDASGQVLCVYDLPQPSTVSRPRSLTFDGTNFWYLLSNLASSDWIYRFQPE
jgi:hypothetical protein